MELLRQALREREQPLLQRLELRVPGVCRLRVPDVERSSDEGVDATEDLYEVKGLVSPS